MALITTNYDVKINIIRPFITKNISEVDLSKITQTNTLKYEALKTTAPQSSLEDVIRNEISPLDSLKESIEHMDSIYNQFDDLAALAEKDLNKIVYTYDVSLLENELMANAERALFGSASGVITFAKYKKVLAYEQLLNRQISENMINNGGVLDVA